MKILLAEDSAVYRHLITGHLKRWGFDLAVATDGGRNRIESFIHTPGTKVQVGEKIEP